MPNLNLTHSGNMNITSASLGPGGTLDVQYEPNNTGYITGWTTDPVSGRDDYETGETLTVRFYPQFSGTVLTENFTVSGYDQAGVLRSDTSVLRQGFDADVRHYLQGNLFRPIACVINSSAATENYIDVNITVNSGITNFVLILNGSNAYKRRGYTFVGYIEQPPIPTGSTSLEIVVADTITDSGQASAIYEPSEAYVNLVYSSSNPRVATIDPYTGEITVLLNGTVTFCVEDTFSGLQACKEVDVFTEEIPLQRLNIRTACLVVDSGYPELEIYPENASVDLHYWVEAYPNVGETDVVTIDEYTGEMSVLQTGKAIVNVRDNVSGLNQGVLTCFVKSIPTPATATTIEWLAINTNRIVDSGSTSVSYYPENADVSLRYYTRTPDFISVDENTGEVTVLRTGSAQIEVYDEISHIYYCKDIICIDSEHPVDTGTTINDLDLVVDDEIIENGVAVPVYSPDYAYVDLSFSSSDTDLATIDSNGFITVLDNGTVTFCVRDSVSGLESCKTVAVKKAVYIDWIEINVNDVVVLNGIATASYSPTAGTVSLVYTSSDPDVASIDPSTGEITVFERGDVTFCVRDVYTNKTDCKTVSVRGPEEFLAVTYNVTSTTEATKVVYWVYDEEYMSQGFDAIYYNGVPVEVADLRSFVFPELGEQTILYKMKTTTLTMDGVDYVGPAMCFFNNLPAVVKVKLPVDWELLPTAGGNGFFQGDSNLSEIDCQYIKAITCYAFCGTTIETLYFPLLEVLDDNALRGTAIKELTLPATVRKADLRQNGTNTFLRNITFEGDYPVNGLNVGASSTYVYNVWVPCQYLSNFKSRIYSPFVDKVRCEDNTTAVTITLVYVVTSTTNYTRIITGPLNGSNPAVISIKDSYGEDIPISYTGSWGGYIYQETGDTTVVLTLDLGYLQENGFGDMFIGTAIKSVDLRDNQWRNIPINDLSFSNCTSLVYAALSIDTTAITNSMFSNCSSLQTIIIPDSVTSIGNYAFTYCTNLSGFTIPDGVTSIGNNALANAGAGKLVIPDSVTTIGASAFTAAGFNEYEIGTGIRSIGNYAFVRRFNTRLDYENNITKMTIKALTPPTLQTNSIYGGDSSTHYPIYVPCEALNAYKAVNNFRPTTRLNCIVP